MISKGLNNWFACPRPNPGAETRLFLFPYAGGGPAAFNKWPAALPSSIETWIAHYPGRGSRHKESPIKRLSILSDALAQAIEPLSDKPFAFFGHSFGGLVAYELAWHLRQLNLAQPQILLISACGAPHLPDPHPPIHALPETDFVKSLQALNGIPAEVASQPELLELLLPILRADFEALETYRFSSNGLQNPPQPFDCPILVLGGMNDLRVNQERLEGWAQYTSAIFRALYFPGDHFFIHEAREAVLTSISTELSQLHAKI